MLGGERSGSTSRVGAFFPQACRALEKRNRSFKAILKETFYGDQSSILEDAIWRLLPPRCPRRGR